MTTNLYGIILWQMETYLVNEEPAGNSHDPQAVAIKKVIDVIAVIIWYPVNCWACVKKNNFHLFDIHARLYFRCVKIRLVKIWRIFGPSPISSNFRCEKFPSIRYYEASNGKPHNGVAHP